jgi:predicted nucleic acid-binding protein
MKVVLDTNVVLDWLVFCAPRVAALVNALAAGTLRAVATPAMRAELAHMLASRSLQRWAPDAGAALQAYDRSVQLLADDVVQGPGPPGRPRCTDADDQVFIDLALAARAQWLLSHDRALLRLSRRLRVHGVAVLTPMAWAAQAGL